MCSLHSACPIGCQTIQVIAIVCPGQGSQTPGFLSPWFDLPGNREFIQELSDTIHIDLVTHGTVSDADTIRDTAIAQPLIVAAGLLSYRALRDALGDELVVGGVAGHSVGEITAAGITGVLSSTDALRFVAERGSQMAAAAAVNPTGMCAVVGGDESDVLDTLARCGVAPANFNGGGQIVAAGPMDGLEALRSAPPAGARVIPLQVAGAFHTDAMRPAVQPLRHLASTLSTHDPSVSLWTNADGSLVKQGANFVELLVRQISSPVRWDLCMNSLAGAGATGIIELTPAGALAGLAKRALKGTPVVAIKTPDDIASAVDLVRNDA